MKKHEQFDDEDPEHEPGTTSSGVRPEVAPIAIHGAMPASVPNQNGSIVVVARPGGFIRSWSQPNRIIATFAPAIAITEVMPVMPL
jgi:hypothetical protein